MGPPAEAQLQTTFFFFLLSFSRGRPAVNGLLAHSECRNGAIGQNTVAAIYIPEPFSVHLSTLSSPETHFSSFQIPFLYQGDESELATVRQDDRDVRATVVDLCNSPAPSGSSHDLWLVKQVGCITWRYGYGTVVIPLACLSDRLPG
ncbi:hypothetical protein BX600DRAFT_456696 [Xylariales sp. PMI_506]|nr:hypothetical protein BX600DRAFT_456696 [Xylariales sp. PMI_506]